MRPDRILIGEVRRGEALEMIQAMLSGHAGSLSTLHASSPQTAATRLETLCLMNDAQLPVYVGCVRKLRQQSTCLCKHVAFHPENAA